MAARQDELAGRVRENLADQPTTREVRMFGALSFMVNDKMVVAVQGTGDLLVRIDALRSDELLAMPGAEKAEMGAGRTMGPGWISVDHDAIGTDEQLAFWLDVAMDFNTAAGRGDP